MANIHPTAVVSPRAEIADSVVIEPYSVIDDDVIIGEGCQISTNVRIHAGTRLGKGVRIFHGAAIGGEPQDLKFGGERTELFIGDNTVIREFVTLSRGTKATGKTVIGSNCLLMAYAHVAHDCVIGDNVILVNCVELAGHVEVEEYAIIGGVVPVHQFVRIGRHSMIGGGVRVPKDVPPFILAGGQPVRYFGLNSVGLRRRGFASETRNALKKCYQVLFQSELNRVQAVEKISAEYGSIPEVQQVLEFISKSKRGLLPGNRVVGTEEEL
ncbi:MAG TPA: acyl-ACP--UDP-N-acetylglucosamine O-acyltransferase [bacterium]|jgi:UDP-N-acetylglucosamine acyltransferase